MECFTPGHLLESLLTTVEITLLAQAIKLTNPYQLCLTISRTFTQTSSSVTNDSISVCSKASCYFCHSFNLYCSKLVPPKTASFRQLQTVLCIFDVIIMQHRAIRVDGCIPLFDDTFILLNHGVFSSSAFALMEKIGRQTLKKKIQAMLLKTHFCSARSAAGSLHSTFTDTSSGLQAAASNHSTGQSGELLHLRRQITVEKKMSFDTVQGTTA